MIQEKKNALLEATEQGAGKNTIYSIPPSFPDVKRPWYYYQEDDAFDDCMPDVCPMCDSDNFYYLYRRDGEIIGCDDCIERIGV